MEGLLLVCSSEKGRAYLAELLRQMAVPQIHMAKSGSQARRFLIQGQAPVVIVNSARNLRCLLPNRPLPAW